MNIVLTGFMATGKTEISKAISEISKYNLVDTDDMIVEQEGITINEIFDKCGEEYFRKTECEVIKKAAEMKNVVIATGGGVVLNEQNIENLRKTGVIFNRLEEARKTRPLLKRDSIENIKKRFDDRKPFYDNCDYKIKVIHGRTPRSYAMEILEIMESSQGAGKQ